jgi:hypothetical protein
MEGPNGDGFHEGIQLVYLNALGKKVLGCVARQATRSMIDLSRRLNCVGQTKHKCILSKCAPNRTGGSERARNVVGKIHSIHPLFVFQAGIVLSHSNIWGKGRPG